MFALTRKNTQEKTSEASDSEDEEAPYIHIYILHITIYIYTHYVCIYIYIHVYHTY